MKIVIKWMNVIAFLAMILTNVLANTLPIGGNTTQDISGSMPTLFTPAPITFSIWGIIYLFMGLFVFYQLFLSSGSNDYYNIYARVGIWFVISCLMNIAWIFSWHYQKFGLSVISIIGLLVSLIFISMNYNVNKDSGILERLSVYGFNIYLGWICAATIANISVFLSRTSWSKPRLFDQVWTVMVIIAGMLIGIAFTIYGHRFMATFALIWAYCGILIRHISTQGYSQAYPLIIITTACCILAMLSMIVITSVMPEKLIVED